MTDFLLFLSGIYIGGAIVAGFAAHLGPEGDYDLWMVITMVFLWFITIPIIVIFDTWEHYQKIKEGSTDD